MTLMARVHYKKDNFISYIEGEIQPNEFGIYKYDGYLHMKAGNIKLKNIISEEVFNPLESEEEPEDSNEI